MNGNKNLVQKELLTGEQVFLKRCVFLLFRLAWAWHSIMVVVKMAVISC